MSAQKAIGFVVAVSQVAVLMLALDSNVKAQEAKTFYKDRLLLSGYLLRSSVACHPNDWKQKVDFALNLIRSSKELSVFIDAFPDTTKQWGADGAANFNSNVMKDGMRLACARADLIQAQVAQTLRNTQRP